MLFVVLDRDLLPFVRYTLARVSCITEILTARWANYVGLIEAMKKIKNEAALVKEALRVGAIYAEKRGVGKFEATDSSHDKITYLYRLLVHDKLIQPLAKGQENEPAKKHKLALWIARQLPSDHELLK